MAEAPLILMMHEDRAWLVRGDWNRSVNKAEFKAWAAYSGAELRSTKDSRSRFVVFATEPQKRLFEAMWM